MLNQRQNYLFMYQHSIVNDLAFILFAPELMQHDYTLTIEPTAERHNWLHQLDQQAEKLATINTRQPLGRYYESLWALFFREDAQFELIAENLVLQGHDSKGFKKTLGEFDFIIFDKHSNRYYHLEIAIKYYLFFNSHPSLSEQEQSHWLGPNSQDNLHKKWQHLINSQSLLSTKPEAQALLESLNIPSNKLERKISAKGYLFHPQPQQGKLPKQASAQALSPYYYFDQPPKNISDEPLYLITKNRWLSTTHHKDDIATINIAELQQQLEQKQSPLLLAHCKPSEGNTLSESERFFVCPSSWPYCLIKPHKSLNPNFSAKPYR